MLGLATLALNYAANSRLSVAASITLNNVQGRRTSKQVAIGNKFVEEKWLAVAK